MLCILILIGIQKLSQGKEEQLSQGEEENITKLLLPNQNNVPVAENQSSNFAHSILSKAAQTKKKKYMDVDFIPVGSVMVESLFSIVGYMFDERRLSTSPVHLEEQVFLRMNNHLWNLNSFLKMDIPELESVGTQ